MQRIIVFAIGCFFIAPVPQATALCTAGDADTDGICDDIDNCTGKANPTQCDVNSDGYGNACDGDYDNDGTVGLVPDWNDFLTALGEGVGPAQDSNCDGVVGYVPDLGDFLDQFSQQFPGPSGPCTNDDGLCRLACSAVNDNDCDVIRFGSIGHLDGDTAEAVK
jgi:hypothetical protein